MICYLNRKYCLQYQSCVCCLFLRKISIIPILSFNLTRTSCHHTSSHEAFRVQLQVTLCKIIVGNVAWRQVLRVLWFSLAKCFFTHLSTSSSCPLTLALNKKRSIYHFRHSSTEAILIKQFQSYATF